ncbi:uncharacterized protein LOC123927864 [Meles meles]|uniref:uncharacterized protein LOC123927864 n=1 Tax=Meles meles TaxID=9662 RepID=UPI001E69B271|nr:uncharacterized protein LOC123927864 [Meles meles]
MEEEQKLKPMMPGIVQAGGAAMDARALGSGRLALPQRALPAVPGQRLGVCAPSARPPRPRLSVESRGAFQMGAEREPLLRGLAWSKARDVSLGSSDASGAMRERRCQPPGMEGASEATAAPASCPCPGARRAHEAASGGSPARAPAGLGVRTARPAVLLSGSRRAHGPPVLPQAAESGLICSALRGDQDNSFHRDPVRQVPPSCKRQSPRTGEARQLSVAVRRCGTGRERVSGDSRVLGGRPGAASTAVGGRNNGRNEHGRTVTMGPPRGAGVRG